MKAAFICLFIFFSIQLFAQEPYLENKTYEYEELQAEYKALTKKYPNQAKLVQFGTSDYGKNIQLFMISKTGAFQPEEFKSKTVLLINNAIHPGEPCGVDACVKLSKDLLKDQKLPENVVIGIVPMYNVGGAHNRNCCSRANQNGPEEYGFRGNAKNLDLNRDFVKCDSKNTQTFYKIFHFLNPHIFIDTHTSDGADYQHVMTLITSQINKMHPWLKKFTDTEINPHLYSEMAKSGYDMVPYVHSIKKTPDDGIVDYLETPRYSTGYTNLFNTISYVSEAHMLKTYKERVESTYELLKITIDYMENNSRKLWELKKKADYNVGQNEYYDLNWTVDTNNFAEIDFKGYEAETKKSEVTQMDRLFYNHNKPYTKKIKYYNSYKCTDSVTRPEYYVIPQAWKDVVVRLQLSEVLVYRLLEDMDVEVESYFIDDYTTGDRPYEGHYLHKAIQVQKESTTITYHKGDYVIPTRNEKARFIIETLEPHAPDSYFAWNFFDAILQQKEWFSAYVFEDKAMDVLAANPELKKEFEQKKKDDKKFREDGWSQLYFIYKNSDNYERAYNRYPISRKMDEFNQDEIELATKLFK
jgi:Zinc carboxypeptidase